MEIKPLTKEISVSPQIKHRDVYKIQALGYKTIINNRPDREEPFQPRTKSLAAKAKDAGLNYDYLPVISGKITEENVREFKALLADMEKPILAFCRTGTRSANLWARANPDGLSASILTEIGKKNGYTL